MLAFKYLSHPSMLGHYMHVGPMRSLSSAASITNCNIVNISICLEGTVYSQSLINTYRISQSSIILPPAPPSPPSPPFLPPQLPPPDNILSYPMLASFNVTYVDASTSNETVWFNKEEVSISMDGVFLFACALIIALSQNVAAVCVPDQWFPEQDKCLYNNCPACIQVLISPTAPLSMSYNLFRV